MLTSEVEERPRPITAGYGRHGSVNGLTKEKKTNPNFAEFLAFLGLFWMDFPNLSPRDPSFGKFGHVINRKTYGPFVISRTPLLALEEMLSEKR